MTEFSSPSVYMPAGQFRIGTVITQSINLYLRDFWRLSLIACMAYIPVLLVSLLRTGLQPGGAATIGAFATVLQIVVSQIVQSMIIYAGVRSLHGRGWTIAESLSVGFARLWPVIGLAILVQLTIMAWSLLLLIPGIMAAIRLWVVVPVCVVERLGPIASMKRSAVLTKGHRWQIFGLAAVLIIGALIIMSIVGGIAWRLGAGGIGGPLVSVVTVGMQAILAALGAVFAGVIYHELRVEKEGANLDDITRVFD